jgi:hypothetical protein
LSGGKSELMGLPDAPGKAKPGGLSVVGKAGDQVEMV